MIINRLKTYI